MTGEPAYIDTGALAKWYLDGPRSDDFEAFIAARSSAAISRLSVVEFRCLLARRRRSGDITRTIERRVLGAFEGDIIRGSLTRIPSQIGGIHLDWHCREWRSWLNYRTVVSIRR